VYFSNKSHLSINHHVETFDFGKANPRIGGVGFCEIAAACLLGHSDFGHCPVAHLFQWLIKIPLGVEADYNTQAGKLTFIRKTG
jgi:hypothetical protein